MVFIDKNAPIPDFENTPDGIKRKNQFIYDRDNHIGHMIVVPAKEFKGIISKVFAPYIDLYLVDERKKFDEIIHSVTHSFKEDIDPNIHMLTSLSTLITRMKKTINNCTDFNIPNLLFDLFLIIKDLLVKYSESLTRILPYKPKGNDQLVLICVIINTSSHLLATISSLSNTIMNLVPDEQKPAIKVDDAFDSICCELKKQLEYLSDVITKECEIYLIKIGNNAWQENDENETEEVRIPKSIFSGFYELIKDFNGGNAYESDHFLNIRLPSKLIQILNDKFEILDEWLFGDNFSRIRPIFISKVIKIVQNSLFKSKSPLLQTKSYQILQSVKELKKVLIEFTKADSQIAKQRIEYEFVQIEVELTVLCCSDDDIVTTYLLKIRNPSKNHFLSILKLKGIKDISKYDIEYDRITSHTIDALQI